MVARVTVQSPELSWRGEWDAETVYPAESVVSYEGSSWVTEVKSHGQEPTNGWPWSLLALRGEQGPPGEPGTSGDAAARIPPFIQSMPEEIWQVHHNLGYDPAVEVLDSSGRRVVTEVVYVVPGQYLEVRNIYPFSGKAILV